MRTITKVLCLLICMAALSACGFHLEGRQILPAELHTVYVQSRQFDPFTKNLNDALSAAGANIASSPKEAPITLKIISKDRGQTAMTVGASQQSKEYRLTYTVRFSLLNQSGNTIAGPFEIREERMQILQASQILGATGQTDDLYDDMMKEAVDQVMDRLGSVSTQNALNKQKLVSHEN